MFEIICVSNLTSSFLFPKNLQDKLNAMLRSTRSIGNSTIIHLRLLGKTLKQRAFIARSLKGVNQQGLSLKTLCSSINIIASRFLAILIDLKDDIIQILPGLNIIQTSNNDWKLQIDTKGYLLNSFIISCNFYPRASLWYKRGNCFSLRFPNIMLTKHELPIQISKINCIHVNQMDIPDPAQSKVFHDLASQSSGSHY